MNQIVQIVVLMVVDAGKELYLPEVFMSTFEIW